MPGLARPACAVQHRRANKTMPHSPPTRWEPDRAVPQVAWHLPPLQVALGRGLLGRCPSCGEAPIFDGFLRVVPECRNCAAPLGLARADDAPPYFTIVIVGHIIVPGMLMLERSVAPPLWLQAAIWLPLTLVLALGLLRPIKGATVGLMLKLGLLKQDGED
jgi:uncharacterized protein (DUF983 family)